MNTGYDEDIAIRERLERGFAGRATVRIAEAAGLLDMTEKTLRRHVAGGNVTFRATGTGVIRMRREFALSDLLGFYASRKIRGEPPVHPRGRAVLRAAPNMKSFLSAASRVLPARPTRTARSNGR